MMCYLLLCAILHQPVHVISNHDKLLTGTDKIVFITSLVGERWTITHLSAQIDAPREDLAFVVWIEDPPYIPYRNPQTGTLEGCGKCVTLTSTPATAPLWTLRDIVIERGSRLGVAVVKHGEIGTPVQLWLRVQTKKEIINQ